MLQSKNSSVAEFAQAPPSLPNDNKRLSIQRRRRTKDAHQQMGNTSYRARAAGLVASSAFGAGKAIVRSSGGRSIPTSQGYEPSFEYSNAGTNRKVDAESRGSEEHSLEKKAVALIDKRAFDRRYPKESHENTQNPNIIQRRPGAGSAEAPYHENDYKEVDTLRVTAALNSPSQSKEGKPKGEKREQPGRLAEQEAASRNEVTVHVFHLSGDARTA